MPPDSGDPDSGDPGCGAARPVELVGLVVVSHSRTLANATVTLASEMLHGKPVRIEVAAGLDEQTLGTDAVAIKAAIEQVAGPAGVVVLMDLGSAVLSAELALDLLDDPELRERIVLSAAPLVEGLVVAAVAAAGGADRFEVAAEARNALFGKVAQLTGPTEPDGSAEPDGVSKAGADEPAEVMATFTVGNRHGLHARPAARLVGELRGLDARLTLRNLSTGAGPVSASSLTKVATLGALRHHRIEVLGTGRQAREAVDHLLALAERRFDEPPDDEPPNSEPPDDDSPNSELPDDVPAAGPVRRSEQVRATSATSAGPRPASPGIGIGPVRRLRYPTAPAHSKQAGSPAEEWQRVTAAITRVCSEIERYQALAVGSGSQEAQIFDAHLMLLDDEELLDDVRQRLAGGVDAAAACLDALAVVERQWAELADPYQRARAEDVRAVTGQLLAALTGGQPVTVSGGGILVARELTPGQVAELDAEAVRGIVLAAGSPSSHAAILARSRGIPTVVAAGSAVLGLVEGTMVALDGGTGELLVDPPETALALFRQRASELAERQAAERSAAGAPAKTLDGTRIAVQANLGSVADARTAAEHGADGAGLVRTEFLFSDRDKAPDRNEQLTEYLDIAEALPGRRITLRTLDIGGDKPVSYLPLRTEDNPYLGQRGIRLGLAHRELLQEQLAAVCEVARRGPTSVMFPMVTTVAELRTVRALLEESAGPAGTPAGLRIGMMVEVPAAALKITSFLPYLDFVSIGTNDLAQYTLAAERGNAEVADLSDPLDPGVLRLIHQVCQAVESRIPVTVCGELAADPQAVPILVGLGVRQLSVAARSVPAVKARVRSLELGRCTALAEAALDLDDAASVRALATSTPTCPVEVAKSVSRG
jgi:multiphosphoryl transfer protein